MYAVRTHRSGRGKTLGRSPSVYLLDFYLSNEGLSILENVVVIGLPIPDKLKAVLEQLRSDGDKNEPE